MWLEENTLSPATSPLYGFTEDHVIPKGIAKLAITVGEHPRISTVIANLLGVDCPLAINGIIRRPILKALKLVTSIYHLTMKFPTTKGMCEVVHMIRKNAITSLKMAEKKENFQE